MTYYSLVFPLFFALAVLVFWLVPPKARPAVLLAASAAYMASWGALSLGVLAGVTLATWACGRGMAAARTTAGRRVFLVLGLLASAGYLFARKAVPLFAPGVSLLTVTGLAFYAMQAAAYIADLYKGRCPVQKSLLSHAVYVSFFPRILSGPIGRPEEFFPQLEQLCTGQRRCDTDRLRRGLVTMLGGWAEKLVISNLLSDWVTPIFARWTECSAPVVAAGALGFAFSLYFDFAGYSHLALGAARVLGIDLPANFRRPFFAQSMGEFWQRWHISLSGWLRDYIYIPLGGSRRGSVRRILNLIATFVVSGLWHGSAWHYLFWGLLHALLQIAGILTKPLRRPIAGRGGAVMVWVRRAFVTLCFAVTLVFFNASSVIQGFGMIGRMCSGAAGLGPLDLGVTGTELAFAALGLVIAFVLDLIAEKAEAEGSCLYDRFAALPAAVRTAALLVLAVTVLVFACRLVGGDAASFYYAQF